MCHWQDAARKKLVQYLTSASVLAHYDEKLEVVVQTNPINLGRGTVLLRDDGAGLRPMKFVSRTFSDVELRYHAELSIVQTTALFYVLRITLYF